MAFAIVGIIGLFPVAMKSAEESQRETRASLAARQIFADLRVADGPNRFVVTGPTVSSTNTLSLAAATNLYVSFANDGIPISAVSQPEFSSSYTSSNAAILACVSVDANTGTPNLSRVQVTVEAPAAAPSTNRSKYTFVTLMNY